jgi:peptide/nickel transport system substrate-binding protein
MIKSANHCLFSVMSILLLFLLACKSDSGLSVEELRMLPYEGKKGDINEVIIHELSDPDKLNPLTSQGASSNYIQHSIFMYLLDVDKEKLEIIPWLAKERPVITALEDGPYKMKLDYEIRPEAVWDNGEPVTGHDVEFSFKATKNPLVDAEHMRPYIDFIVDIEIDKNNPRKFSLYTNEVHFAAEFSSGGVIYIIPEYVYDSEKIMRQFSLKDLSDKEKLIKLRENEDLRRFAKNFNSEKHQRDKGYVVGCGPYTFEGWTTGQRIILQKKNDWWGNAYAGTKGFENYPNKLTYEIINDKVTALSAMKDEKIDVMEGMRPQDFKSLSTDVSFNKRNFMFHPDYLSYVYIGLNMRHPILKDKNVRKALAHCVDVQEIIDVLLYGYAKPIASFVHPSKAHYNHQLKPYSNDLKLAAQYLEEAGWVDTDGDGIRDKVIKGVKTPLKLSIKYNSGNDTREKICLFLRDNAKSIGIDVQIEAREWTVYLEECTKHDFDMFVLGWVQEAILDDPKQLFHTESYNGGSNYSGFGTAETDILIDNLRAELDEEKRKMYYRELQAIIQDEVPYIFLYSPDNILAISKRFGNAKPYVARPGYEEREFLIKPFRGAVQ